jgi:polyisoprenoid-binding protein YceI
MRNWPALLALVACHAAAQGVTAATGAEVFRIDPAATRAEFAVDHFWLATLHGSFARTHGTIVLDSRARTGSIDLAVDADSVATGWSVRDDFIRGQHMFDASSFPEVRFRSRQLAFDGKSLAGATGELTLRDVTRPVAVRVERMDCRVEDRSTERCGVAVVSSIRRSDFGMDFALPFVGDEVALSFHLSVRRVSP